ncbi:lytic transglycosylase [Burkholderia lata]|uniref:Lytic transglycosylase n=2 Tax=Burkholderia lata (strain ATCC 17760 / DSM 23089 / LMG 22485 / NCIMB 9086 / R18194 / 383) TaxID=482957 RepID=A0A6P3C7Z9_BURL3|nr:lytic transglycosylase [Burkholderia lata]VWL96734.1 lytic transglycosylase [Burkholderia lata]
MSCALHGIARADCLDDAAAFQHVSVSLMRGIAQVESGMNPSAVNTNTNGTVDIGLMQINSTWLPTLAREGITRESLFDACTNAYVGAWILSQNIRQLGANWNAIGAYNSASPDKRLAYARKVYDAIRTMPDSPDTPMPILPPSFTPPQQAQAYNPFASLSVSAPQQVTRPRTISSAPPPPPPQGGPAGPAGTYNFGWTVTGADQAKPTQVFDDGARIYVQFSDMKHLPAIFTETSSGRVLMSWELQFPYAVLTRPAQTLIFQLGPFEARAQRSAGNGAGMTAQSGTGGTATAAAAAAGSKKSANTAANAAASPAATASKRTASADALWYVNTPSTSGTTAASPSTANIPATLPTAITSNTPPPAPAQVPAAAAQPSRASADALWYISK